MKMIASHTPGSIKRFRRTSWKFQRTFHTPLKNLEPFVAIILSSIDGLRGGHVVIDQDIGFESRHLAPLLKRFGAAAQLERDWSIETSTPENVQLLLQAALGDWLDFVFVPDPSPFSIYADHDEYCTFFAHSKSNLNRVVNRLIAAGSEVVEYRRML